MRRQIEEAILPLATSVDGRHFTCQVSAHDLALQVGGYVIIEHEARHASASCSTSSWSSVDGPEMGVRPRAGDAQIATTVTFRIVRGSGVVRDGDPTPFHDGLLRPAVPAEVHAWLERVRPARAELEVGELRLAPGAPFRLDAGGFDRHTFLCGQSGSGKTYSLGVMLEQLLLETSLRIVVLDPNSDFVRLGQTRRRRRRAVARRHAATAGVVVRRAAGRGSERLSLRFADLDPRVQAASLRLDPIADREEYAELVALLESWAASGGRTSLPELLAGGGDEAKALGQRLRNLGIDRWQVWARDDPGSVVDDVAGRDSRGVSSSTSGRCRRSRRRRSCRRRFWRRLWRHRADREPTLIVIDEAHNVCPSDPADPVTAIATEHAVRIAAEGRKYGLYLLVSTQRPQKVDEQVLSQCDNLVLMRMNSRSDLAYVGELFSFVPAPLVSAATDFGLGEALLAGKIASHPALVRFGARITEEGGSDVPADWAAKRP